MAAGPVVDRGLRDPETRVGKEGRKEAVHPVEGDQQVDGFPSKDLERATRIADRVIDHRAADAVGPAGGRPPAPGIPPLLAVAADHIDPLGPQLVEQLLHIARIVLAIPVEKGAEAPAGAEEPGEDGGALALVRVQPEAPDVRPGGDVLPGPVRTPVIDGEDFGVRQALAGLGEHLTHGCLLVVEGDHQGEPGSRVIARGARRSVGTHVIHPRRKIQRACHCRCYLEIRMAAGGFAGQVGVMDAVPALPEPEPPWPVPAWGQRTLVMGILNLTPDSFSDGGRYNEVEGAAARAGEMVAEGADLLDLGAESTRPGAVEVEAEEEWARLEPVLRGLAPLSPLPLSVDTYKAGVAERALQAGAVIVNDVWGLRRDPAMAEVVAAAGAGVILMDNRAEPVDTEDCVAVVAETLGDSLERARRAGIAPGRIVLDPGIGFGKTYAQNLEVLRGLSRLRALGYPLLLGASRKSVIGKTLDLPADQRVEGTLALTVAAIAAGVDLVRVHDVCANLRAARMADALYRAVPPPAS